MTINADESEMWQSRRFVPVYYADLIDEPVTIAVDPRRMILKVLHLLLANKNKRIQTSISP